MFMRLDLIFTSISCEQHVKQSFFSCTVAEGESCGPENIDLTQKGKHNVIIAGVNICNKC